MKIKILYLILYGTLLFNAAIALLDNNLLAAVAWSSNALTVFFWRKSMKAYDECNEARIKHINFLYEMIELRDSFINDLISIYKRDDEK